MGSNDIVLILDKIKIDRRPARYGWAIGAYTRECFICNQSFVGAKNANMCADCAYDDTPSLEDQLKQDEILQALSDIEKLVNDGYWITYDGYISIAFNKHGHNVKIEIGKQPKKGRKNK